MHENTPKELIDLSIKRQGILRHYLDMETWTPMMGVLLLAGIHPPPNCTKIPADGGISLDGAPINARDQEFRDARTILEVWEMRCEDLGDHPPHIAPHEFLNWAAEYQVRESNAMFSPFPWIVAFDDVRGVPPLHVPSAIASYAADTAQMVLDKLDEVYKNAPKVKRRYRATVVPVPSGGAEPYAALNPHHKFLTTEEFADAMGVKPQTIYKNHSKKGHYLGVIPETNGNRFLAWPLDSVERAQKWRPGG